MIAACLVAVAVVLAPLFLSPKQSINYAIIEHFAAGGKNEAFFEFYSANFARYLANCCTLIEFRAANINFPRFSKR